MKTGHGNINVLEATMAHGALIVVHVRVQATIIHEKAIMKTYLSMRSASTRTPQGRISLPYAPSFLIIEIISESKVKFHRHPPNTVSLQAHA